MRIGPTFNSCLQAGHSPSLHPGGRKHFVHLSLACVLSLAIFGVLLQSWELCLVLGLASILSLGNFLGFATCQYIEVSDTFKLCNVVGLVFC